MSSHQIPASNALLSFVRGERVVVGPVLGVQFYGTVARACNFACMWYISPGYLCERERVAVFLLFVDPFVRNASGGERR